MRSFRALIVTLGCLPIVAGCIAEGAESAPEVEEAEGVAADELSSSSATIVAPTLTTGTFKEAAPTKSVAAPPPLSTAKKAQLVSEAKTTFSLLDLEVNEAEALEVTIDDPRIVDRAALGTRFMHWTDPQTSAVTPGYGWYMGGGTQTPYARLRIDASFGELYLVDCTVTAGTYQVQINDVSGLGGATQSVQAATVDGHFVFAFDPGPGGYKQAYIQRSTGTAQAWQIWGCEILPLE